MLPGVKLIIDIGMNIGYRDGISLASFDVASLEHRCCPGLLLSHVCRALPNPIEITDTGYRMKSNYTEESDKVSTRPNTITQCWFKGAQAAVINVLNFTSER